jgi:hypothetical protein
MTDGRIKDRIDPGANAYLFIMHEQTLSIRTLISILNYLAYGQNIKGLRWDLYYLEKQNYP